MPHKGGGSGAPGPHGGDRTTCSLDRPHLQPEPALWYSQSDFDLIEKTRLKIRADTVEAKLRGRPNVVLVPSVTLQQGDGLPSIEHRSVPTFKSEDVPSFKREGVPSLENEGAGLILQAMRSPQKTPSAEFKTWHRLQKLCWDSTPKSAPQYRCPASIPVPKAPKAPKAVYVDIVELSGRRFLAVVIGASSSA
ncbi:hypothetical protein Daus18300_006940 [Diaporthe australafricana]|uniref:Uncharacterized protein n=1 Tax=Diaporthe australafricana TaxID=127596 RepID=A0ABR3WRK5_9PEZI